MYIFLPAVTSMKMMQWACLGIFLYMKLSLSWQNLLCKFVVAVVFSVSTLKKEMGNILRLKVIKC